MLITELDAADVHVGDWRERAIYGPEYLAPEYYERLLKPYMFSGRTDLALLRGYLGQAPLQARRMLELGPGTGRGTRLVLDECSPAELDLVDLSSKMLQELGNRLDGTGLARLIRSDALDFALGMTGQYDLIYSLWSLSHSVHQRLADRGYERGWVEAETALTKLLDSGLEESGRFFFIHFDSTSEEQRISLKQRSRIFPWLQAGIPSPSEQLITTILSALQDRGVLSFTKARFQGDPIIYRDIDEALEVFMNFHMEGIFNNRAEFWRVVTEVTEDLQAFRYPDGRIAIQPCCIVFSGLAVEARRS